MYHINSSPTTSSSTSSFRILRLKDEFTPPRMLTRRQKQLMANSQPQAVATPHHLQLSLLTTTIQQSFNNDQTILKSSKLAAAVSPLLSPPPSELRMRRKVSHQTNNQNNDLNGCILDDFPELGDLKMEAAKIDSPVNNKQYIIVSSATDQNVTGTGGLFWKAWSVVCTLLSRKSTNLNDSAEAQHRADCIRREQEKE